MANWLSQFRGANAGSGGGFGAAAVARAKAAGYSDAQIRSAASGAGGAGSQAAAQLSIAPRPAPAPPPPPAAAPARTGIGAAYVQREMGKGRSMASIQQEAANKGYEIGEKAQEMFSQGSGGGGGGAAPAASGIGSHNMQGERTGIGAAYVQEQLNAGKTLSEIKAHASSRGYKVGDKAQALFAGGGTAPLDWLKTYRGAQGGRDSKNFGAAALQRARDAGRSDADIQSQITAGGWNLGSAAQQALGGGGSVQDALQGQRNIWAHYNPESGGGWGSGANSRALQAGLTRSEIRSQLSESGLRIGEEAAKDLNVHAQQTSHIRPDDIKDSQDGYNTRYVMMPRDVRVNHLNREEGDPDKYSTGTYAIGGYSDASLANLFRSDNADHSWDGPHKHGTRGTYQDSDWDYNIGGGMGHDSERPNFYWDNADRDALASHNDAWRGHGYDGRTTTPTQTLKGRGGLKDATGWTAEHEADIAMRGRDQDTAETYNETFREASNDIAQSTSTTSAPADNIVKAEESVLDNDKPVVEVIDKNNNPLASGSSGSSSGRPGTHAPYHLATGSAQYYRSRFG